MDLKGRWVTFRVTQRPFSLAVYSRLSGLEAIFSAHVWNEPHPSEVRAQWTHYKGQPRLRNVIAIFLLISAQLLSALIAFSASAQDLPTIRTLVPSILKVGKWAEGIADDGAALWVAESGQRSVLRIARDGTTTRYPNVGRLPVGMVALPTGDIYSLVETDQIIWQPIAGSTKGRAVKWIGDCPQGLAADAQTLWVLTWPDCTSRNSRVVRLDPKTGAVTQTASLGEWAQAIITGHGRVWVAHASKGHLDAILPTSLAVETRAIDGASLWALAVNRTALFAGGRLGDSIKQGLIVSIDPQTGREEKRLPVDGMILAMVADEEAVVAINDTGTIYVVSAKGFTLKSTVTLSIGPYRPSSVLIRDDNLVIVAQQYQGENGALLTVSHWR